MTSQAWPSEYEWDLWFSNKIEEACWLYRLTLSHWWENENSRPPSGEEVKKIFKECLEIKCKGLRPYERFLRRRTRKICELLETNNILGHW